PGPGRAVMGRKGNWACPPTPAPCGRLRRGSASLRARPSASVRRSRDGLAAALGPRPPSGPPHARGTWGEHEDESAHGHEPEDAPAHEHAHGYEHGRFGLVWALILTACGAASVTPSPPQKPEVLPAVPSPLPAPPQVRLPAGARPLRYALDLTV